MEYNRPLPRRSPARRRVRDAQNALDSAVRKAYGMKDGEDTLAFLLALNLELAEKEAKSESVTPPKNKKNNLWVFVAINRPPLRGFKPFPVVAGVRNWRQSALVSHLSTISLSGGKWLI